MDWKTFFSNVLSAYSWPIVLLISVVYFHDDISELTKRAKSIEVAGTKSEFVDYAAAFGYVESKLDKLASESDLQEREKLRNQIAGVTKDLQGLHPISLGFLIAIGRNVSADQSWETYPDYVFELMKSGYIEFDKEVSTPEHITYELDNPENTVYAHLTDKGRSFLIKLGFDNIRKP